MIWATLVGIDLDYRSFWPVKPSCSLAQPGTAIPHRRSVQMVRDSAYLTFKALLYYLYTDTIEFTPLTSSFLSSDIAADESSGGSGLSRQDRLRHGSTSTESLNEEMRKAHAK